MRHGSRYLVGLLLASLPLGACSESDVFSDSRGSLQEKPKARRHADALVEKQVRRPVVRAGYRLAITSANADFCSDGYIELTLYDDLSLEIPAAAVSCLTLNLDLKKMLSGLQRPDGSQEAPPGGIDLSDGRLVRVKTIKGVTFEPARPLIIIPPLQRPDALAPFAENRTYQASFTDADGQAKTATGNIAVNVPEVRGTLISDAGPVKLSFDHVLRFIMTSDGFAGMKRAENFLLDQLEIDLNTEPLTIPRIHVEASVSSLTEGQVLGGVDGLGPLGDALLGNISIDLTITKQEFIK